MSYLTGWTNASDAAASYYENLPEGNTSSHILEVRIVYWNGGSIFNVPNINEAQVAMSSFPIFPKCQLKI